MNIVIEMFYEFLKTNKPVGFLYIVILELFF